MNSAGAANTRQVNEFRPALIPDCVELPHGKREPQAELGFWLDGPWRTMAIEDIHPGNHLEPLSIGSSLTDAEHIQ